jgi:hypothetical protein
MPAPRPPWQQQRIPPDVERRLQRLEAAAHEAVLDVHAELACDMVDVLASRMPFDEAIARYVRVMDLDPDETEAVGSRAVTLLGARPLPPTLPRDRFDWKWATPLGAVRLLRRKRVRDAEEGLWTELATARAEERLTRLHARYALRYVELLEAHADPSRAVALYLERLHVPELRARGVYQRVLARLAESLLPGLDDAG